MVDLNPIFITLGFDVETLRTKLNFNEFTIIEKYIASIQHN